MKTLSVPVLVPHARYPFAAAPTPTPKKTFAYTTRVSSSRSSSAAAAYAAGSYGDLQSNDATIAPAE